jgi:hypothetical protein
MKTRTLLRRTKRAEETPTAIEKEAQARRAELAAQAADDAKKIAQYVDRPGSTLHLISEEAWRAFMDRARERHAAQFPTDPLESFYDACSKDQDGNVIPDDPDRAASIREMMARCKARTDLHREPTADELEVYLERERQADAFHEAFRAKHGRYVYWVDYPPDMLPWELPPDEAMRWIENYSGPYVARRAGHAEERLAEPQASGVLLPLPRARLPSANK